MFRPKNHVPQANGCNSIKMSSVSNAHSVFGFAFKPDSEVVNVCNYGTDESVQWLLANVLVLAVGRTNYSSRWGFPHGLTSD